MSPPPLAHPEALSPPGHAALRTVARCPFAAEAYLAGSAALALYTGHRPVRDLDLMTAANRLTGPERRDVLGELRAADPETTVETARDGYLFARLAGGVGMRAFYYPYPLVDPCQEMDGVAVASAVDLGLMKLAAIISRGERRDFVDLYLLGQQLPLALLLRRAEEKFGHVGDFPLQALKALADLSAAEDQPMPNLTRPLAWPAVEAWLADQVRTLGRAHAGLR